MGLDNPLHWAFILVILLLIFGARRLPEIGRSLGSGMREFKDSISGDSKPTLDAGQQQPQATQPPVAQPPAAQPPAAQAPAAQPQQPAATPPAPPQPQQPPPEPVAVPPGVPGEQQSNPFGG